MSNSTPLSHFTTRAHIRLIITILVVAIATCPHQMFAEPAEGAPGETKSLSGSERARFDFKDEYQDLVKKLNTTAHPESNNSRDAAGVLGESGPEAEASVESLQGGTLHVLFRGDEGIPFPSASEVVLKLDSDPQHQTTPTPWPSPTPWSKPGRCDRNETSLVELKTGGDDIEIRYDLLFLPEHLVPLQPDEVFGAEVTLYPYGETSGISGELWQKVNDVPCVPYRVRLTERGYRYDFGNHALKNYSKGQSSKGEFHPWIAERLFGTTKPTTHRHR